MHQIDWRFGKYKNQIFETNGRENIRIKYLRPGQYIKIKYLRPGQYIKIKYLRPGQYKNQIFETYSI